MKELNALEDDAGAIYRCVQIQIAQIETPTGAADTLLAEKNQIVTQINALILPLTFYELRLRIWLVRIILF